MGVYSQWHNFGWRIALSNRNSTTWYNSAFSFRCYRLSGTHHCTQYEYTWINASNGSTAGWHGWFYPSASFNTDFTLTLTPPSSGTWYLRVKAHFWSDTEGGQYHSIQDSVDARFDSILPTISFSPNSDSSWKKSLTVTVTTSDTGGSGMNTVENRYETNGS